LGGKKQIKIIIMEKLQLQLLSNEQTSAYFAMNEILKNRTINHLLTLSEKVDLTVGVKEYYRLAQKNYFQQNINRLVQMIKKGTLNLESIMFESGAISLTFEEVLNLDLQKPSMNRVVFNAFDYYVGRNWDTTVHS
jgi:hypothetical protein